MNTNKIFSFLSNLQENNSKAWMDANRKEYQATRDEFIGFVDKVNTKMVATYPAYFDTPGKKSIERINNNLMFHPERPTYKDHFGAVLDKITKGTDFYFMIGVNECMLGAGMWHPESKTLKSVRAGIDYNGAVLKEIIREKDFVETFGELYQGSRLKTSPMGYDKNHPHIDLLRLKSFAVMKNLTREEVESPDFADRLVEMYGIVQPFLNYLREAATV